MTLVTRVSIPVDARAPGGATNAYLVGERDALVVDPAADGPALFEALAGRDVGHVAVTHAHPDHVGGVAALADRTGATVWARRGYGERFAAAAGVEPDRTFAEGTRIPTDAGPVTVLDTPGHAPDHVSFSFVPRAGDAASTPDDEAAADADTDRRASVLCGDLATAEGSVAVCAPEGEMRAYFVSLRRLRARDPVALYPGHGSRIDDPRAAVDRLLAHRRDRERRVAAAVTEGARDPDAVTAAAYDKDLSGVRELARATVVAHVEKLAAEGRVRWDPDRERVEPA